MELDSNSEHTLLSQENITDDTRYYTGADAMSAPLSRYLLPDSGRSDVTMTGIEAILPPETAVPMASQRHYIDGALYEGDYPDPGVREAVASKRTEIHALRNRFHEALDGVPDRSGRHEEAIHWMRNEAAADLGARALDLPVSVLAPEHFTQVRRAIGLGKAAGMYRHGRIVVCSDPEIQKHYGDRPLMKTLAHEFAHGAYEGDDWSVLTLPLQPHQRLRPDDIVTGGRIVRIVQTLGLCAPDPDMPWDPAFSNAFLEEGAVESYALEKRDAYLPPLNIDGQVMYDAPLDSERTVHTHYANAGLRLTDPHTGTLCLPWKYAASTALRKDGRITTLTSGVTLAAFGIDLLEAYRMPGLRAELLASRNDPAQRVRIRDRIDRVYDGDETSFYTRLSRVQYIVQDLMAGVRMVVKALDIEDEPMFRVARHL